MNNFSYQILFRTPTSNIVHTNYNIMFEVYEVITDETKFQVFGV